MTPTQRVAMTCPFCGSKRIGTHYKKSGAKSGYQCMCLDCKVAQTGCYHPSIDAAREEWSKRAALAEQPAEQSAEHGEPVAQRWQPIETAPKGRIVLVYYKNSLGNGRTMRARYYLPETLDSDTTESGWADEGWYEESEAYEYLMPLDHDPTHWMPLPAGPDTAPQPAKREPLTPPTPLNLTEHEASVYDRGWYECERAHGITGETQ